MSSRAWKSVLAREYCIKKQNKNWKQYSLNHYHHCLFDGESNGTWFVHTAPSTLVFLGYTGRRTFDLWMLKMLDYETGTPLQRTLKVKALLSMVHKRNMNL